MYQVRAVHRTEGWAEIWRETDSAREAYELAHQLQAAIWGLANSTELVLRWADQPFVAAITDKAGKDAWQECARLACPTVGFQ